MSWWIGGSTLVIRLSIVYPGPEFSSPFVRELLIITLLTQIYDGWFVYCKREKGPRVAW